MRSSIRRLLGILSLTALATSAHASLVSTDLNTPGDSLITVDTASGLAWLDITQTENTSYNDILADTHGWLARGFRLATRSELERLFTDAGVLALGPPRAAGNAPGVQNLIDTLGCNLCFVGSNQVGGAAMFFDSILDAQGQIGWATYDIGVDGTGFASAQSTQEKRFWSDLRALNVSTFLVAPALVPLPPSAWMLLAAVGLLVARRLNWTLRVVPAGTFAGN